MFCSSCGTQIPDGQYTCYVCGSYVGSGQQSQPQQNVYNQSQYQPNNTYQNLMNQANYEPASYQPQMGMKWYKFVIYFMLFLSAIINLFGCIGIMTGSHYTSESGINYADDIYELYDGLKALDIFMGISCIALAIYALFVRAMLAEYRKIGPKLFIAMYAIDIVSVLIYTILVTSVTPIAVADVLDLKDIVINVFWIVINKIYFDNRKHLFVN